MGGKGKGGARAAYLPPARSRAPGADTGGPTITEKIAARKAGSAESWDAFKSRVAEKQAEQAALENQDVLLSSQHRELLDRERDARLARGGEPDAKRHKSDKEKHKKHKHKEKHKHKKDKHKHKKEKGKGKDRKKDKKRDRDSSSSSSSEDDEERGKPDGPVRLSDFMRASDDDVDEPRAADRR